MTDASVSLALTTMSRPFHGMLFCCTGIPVVERRVVCEKIASLGGDHSMDLTSLVRYLVVGNRNTEKFQYSVRQRHDITFLSVAAIDDLHRRWAAGEDVAVDFDAVALPVFSGFKICLARVERPSKHESMAMFAEDFRTPAQDAKPPHWMKDAFLPAELEATLKLLGASVLASLTPDMTYVVSTDTAGRRYTVSKQWGIPAVHPLWVYDSCLRGAALDPKYYLVDGDGGPVYNQGCQAWRRLYRARQEREPARAERRERVPRREHRAWASLIGRAPAAAASESRDRAWDEVNTDNDSDDGDALNVVDSMVASRKPPLFAGMAFFPLGLSVLQAKLLLSVLLSHLGTVVSSADDSRVTHIVVLARNGPAAHSMLLMLPKSTSRRVENGAVAIVTDWFIERSIFYGELRDDVWGRPLAGLVPLKTRFLVCLTGFTGVELLHLEKLIDLLGLQFCDVLNAKRDLLVANVNVFREAFEGKSPALFAYSFPEIVDCPVHVNGDTAKSVLAVSAKNKLAAAKKWGIPVVSIAFIWECVQRLAGHLSLVFPDILDLTWCIHLPPGDARHGSLMEHQKATFPSVLSAAALELSGSASLPSPRKSKEKVPYGRLAGGGKSLTDQLNRARDELLLDSRPPRLAAEENLESDELLLSIAYVNLNSVQSREELMRKLEGSKPKRPRRAAK